MFNSTPRGSDGQPAASSTSAAAGSRPGDRDALLAQLAQSLVTMTRDRVSAELRSGRTAPEVARAIGDIVGSHFRAGGVSLSVIELRENVARCIAASRGAAGQPAAAGPTAAAANQP